MFEFVRRHNRILQFALVLLIFPSFVLFGVQGYQQFSEKNEAAASVAGRDISKAELDTAFRNQVERMRAQMPGLDAKAFDTPEMRQRVLDELIRERVSMEAARKLILTPTDEQVIQTFQTDPQFSGLRNGDGTVRKELLASRGVSSEQFVQQLKQDLATRQVFSGIGGSVPSADRVAQQALATMFQQRDILVARFSAKDFAGRVTVSDADLQAFYEDAANTALFLSREQAQIDYVVLDLEAVTQSIKVSDEELRKYYTENVARYTQVEERRARQAWMRKPGRVPRQRLGSVTFVRIGLVLPSWHGLVQKIPARQRKVVILIGSVVAL
jgi:peptidyl-prolyl cis-trans isomerase D